MTGDKCENFDKGFCKYKDHCPKVHPNINCEGDCEDKRVCTKRHQIFCKNGSSCEWKSCEFLHSSNQQENIPTDIKEFNKVVEEKIEAFASEMFASRVNMLFENRLQLFLKENESVNSKIDAIEAEYSSKLEEK